MRLIILIEFRLLNQQNKIDRRAKLLARLKSMEEDLKSER